MTPAATLLRRDAPGPFQPSHRLDVGEPISLQRAVFRSSADVPACLRNHRSRPRRGATRVVRWPCRCVREDLWGCSTERWIARPV